MARSLNPNQKGFGLFIKDDGTMEVAPVRADFRIVHHGSITTFEPLTAAAKAWVHEHVALEGWQWMGNNFGIDHRPAQGLIAAIDDWGLEIEEQ